MAGTPDQIAQDWAQKLGASGDKIARGVAGVTVAPGQAAARQKAVWASNTAASADKWASRTSSVPLGDWQQSMTSKGVPRIAQGAQASQQKFAQFMGQLLPHIASVQGSLQPRGNLEQNINRMTQFVRGMSTFKRR